MHREDIAEIAEELNGNLARVAVCQRHGPDMACD
jgi:hypothetical protein